MTTPTKPRYPAHLFAQLRKYPIRHYALTTCGKQLTPNLLGSGKLETLASFKVRKTCDAKCLSERMREITSARLAKAFPEKERTALPIPPTLEAPTTVDRPVSRPLPNPRKKRAHIQSGTDAGTMHNLKSKEGVPKLLDLKRSSGVKLPQSTKGELCAALSRALRLHAPDLLEAWPGYEPLCSTYERQLKGGRCRFCETVWLTGRAA